MPKIIPAANRAELFAALRRLTGGETIELAGGAYGPLSLTNGKGFDLTYLDTVTLAAADPLTPPVFSSLELRNATNLRFEGITFKYGHGHGKPVYERPFRVIGALDVGFGNCLFDGDMAPEMVMGPAPNGAADASRSYPVGFGLDVSQSVGVVLEECVIRRFLRGLLVQDSDDITLSGNDLYGIRMEAMALAAVQGVIIEQNRIHDFIRPPQEARISEMIHFWTNGTTRPSTDIVIRGNRLDICAGLHSRSIVLRNDIVEAGFAEEEMFYRAVRIEENLIVNGHASGIRVGETTGLVISNNTVMRADGANGFVDVPRIQVAPASTGVEIRQNACAVIPAHPAWQVERNLLIQDRDPQASGWYGDVFHDDSLTPAADGYHRPRPRADGPLARLQAGVGGQSWPETAPEGPPAALQQPLQEPVEEPLQPAAQAETLPDLPPDTSLTVTAVPEPLISDPLISSALPPQPEAQDLAIAISLDAETCGRAGEVARMGNGLVARITDAGGLELTIRAATGGAEVLLAAPDHSLDDGQPHEAELRLVQTRLELWLDGQKAAEAAFDGQIADLGAAEPDLSPAPKDAAEPSEKAEAQPFSLDISPPVF